jgi:methionyl-tRNA formyltransferase
MHLSFFDTIHTAQQKARVVFNRIIKEHFNDIISGTVDWKTFPQDEPSWYEKRTPASGRIDWTLSAAKIHNFVRAQTAPYPGAFTIHNGEEARIWSGFPYGFDLMYPSEPGKVLEVFLDGSFLIQTGNCPFLCTHHELSNVKRGIILT